MGSARECCAIRRLERRKTAVLSFEGANLLVYRLNMYERRVEMNRPDVLGVGPNLDLD